jgi:hypothetical protein
MEGFRLADKGAHSRGVVYGAAVEHASVHEHHGSSSSLKVDCRGCPTRGSLTFLIKVMGAWDDECSSVDLVDVRKEVNRIDEEGRLGGKARRSEALGLMDAFRVAPWKRDVGNKTSVGSVRPKRFVEKLLNQGPGRDGVGFVNHAGNKEIPLVHQRSHTLLRFRLVGDS